MLFLRFLGTFKYFSYTGTYWETCNSSFWNMKSASPERRNFFSDYFSQNLKQRKGRWFIFPALTSSFLTDQYVNSVILLEFLYCLLHAVLDNYNYHHQFAKLANVQEFVLYFFLPIVSTSIFKNAWEKDMTVISLNGNLYFVRMCSN